MDIFDTKRISPMLIRDEVEPFDSDDWRYELKLDGSRCIAYLGAETVFQNKRFAMLATAFPELCGIHNAALARCILDGELVVMTGGKPDFEALQAREIMTNRMKIEISAKQRPACFVAYDILYRDGEELFQRPLEERQAILRETIRDTERIAVSRHYEREGTALFRLTEQSGLEGIVAKRKGSFYYPGKRTSDWVKIKNLVDEDFVAAGYIDKGSGIYTIVLGQYEGSELKFAGHVTLGVSREKIERFQQGDESPFVNEPKTQTQTTHWFKQMQVVTVTYMNRTKTGGMRQNRLKGFRDDKLASECIVRYSDKKEKAPN